jgi:hypothetical protein
VPEVCLSEADATRHRFPGGVSLERTGRSLSDSTASWVPPSLARATEGFGNPFAGYPFRESGRALRARLSRRPAVEYATHGRDQPAATANGSF